MKKKIAILLGGGSSERHISVESGRNVYEKLLSSEKYEPYPVYLVGDEGKMRFFSIPIYVLLQDNADDIAASLLNKDNKNREILDYFKEQVSEIVSKYGAFVDCSEEITFQRLKEYDFVFIALHGSPGEDGTMQKILEDLNIPYNGSGIEASRLCMNKYNTNQLLKFKGFHVANQLILEKEKALSGEDFEDLQTKISFPMIVKPVDEGCSDGVEKINTFEHLKLYIDDFFKKYPQKNEILVEEFVSQKDNAKLVEITGGFLTHLKDGNIEYEIFSPSESIAAQGILSLAEKFLAGAGKNITPVVFSSNEKVNLEILESVKSEFKKIAKLLNLVGYARIDAFVEIFNDNNFKLYIIEINTLPAMTSATCIFHQCILNGYKPVEFIERIIEFGLAFKR